MMVKKTAAEINPMSQPEFNFILLTKLAELFEVLNCGGAHEHR